MSHPNRGAWIEIAQSLSWRAIFRSHPNRGAWIEIPVVAAVDTAKTGRTPIGVRGLKYQVLCSGLFKPDSRTPIGVRGLKSGREMVRQHSRVTSHPNRGAWIEILIHNFFYLQILSHPHRGGWVEIRMAASSRMIALMVAPQSGCVD